MNVGAQRTLPPELGQRITIMDRVHARLSGMRTQVTGFVYQPEPRSMGSFARGKQLVSGNFQFGGHLVQRPGVRLWDIDAPDAAFSAELNGFGWLDDLAAVGDGVTRKLAQDWVMTWIARQQGGKGAGWSPDLTGRRLIRWIHHAIFLMNGQTVENNAKYFKSLGQQTAFLARRWPVAVPGLPRFEALTGLLYAGISLNGAEHHIATASKALANECNREIDDQGGLSTRNPEELLEVYTLLSWADAALRGAGFEPLEGHRAAMEKIAPSLLALRHEDGRLARFHGGGAGQEGQLDQVLSGAQVPLLPTGSLAMGFTRLSCGQTSLIADVAKPPARKSSLNGHASTLAFELTSARRPVIVNCGSGAPFGSEWRRASRATPSHSTLSIDGTSSAKLTASPNGEILSRGPKSVRVNHSSDTNGLRLMASHDGYRAGFGLTHVRKLELAPDGRRLSGEDSLASLNQTDRETFDRRMDENALEGVGYKLRFHLHPEVEASLDMGGSAVSLALQNGEVWVFRCEGLVEMRVDPSIFLEKGRLKPRPSQQIVLSSRVMEYAGRVSWNLTQAQDTPSYTRNLEQDLRLALDK